MIVISTNNGKNYLNNLLESLEKINLYNQKILIVDTGSTDNEYIKNIKYNKNIIIDKTNYCGYDTGAYIHAFNNYEDDFYICLQDSILIKNENFVYDILKKIKDNNVVPLLTFPPGIYDSDEQKSWLLDKIGSFHYNKGIFGPMFCINKKALELIDKKYFVIPTNKILQQAMERGWSIIFEKYNLNIEQLEEDTWNAEYLFNNKYKYFQKFFPTRK